MNQLNENLATITFQIDNESLKKINEILERNNQNLSILLNDFIIMYINENQEKQEQSYLSLY